MTLGRLQKLLHRHGVSCGRPHLPQTGRVGGLQHRQCCSEARVARPIYDYVVSSFCIAMTWGPGSVSSNELHKGRGCWIVRVGVRKTNKHAQENTPRDL